MDDGALHLRASGAPADCPLCREPVAQGDGWRCEGCGVAYHPECFDELGGCATLACPERGRSRAVVGTAARASVAAPLTRSASDPLGTAFWIGSLGIGAVNVGLYVSWLIFGVGHALAGPARVLAPLLFLLHAGVRVSRTPGGTGQAHCLLMLATALLLPPVYFLAWGWRRPPPP